MCCTVAAGRWGSGVAAVSPVHGHAPTLTLVAFVQSGVHQDAVPVVVGWVAALGAAVAGVMLT